MSGKRNRSDAGQLDLPHGVSKRVVEELHRPVRGAGVIDDQPDLEAVGRLGHAI